MNKRLVRVIAVFAAMLLLVAGCSTGDSGQQPTPTPTAAHFDEEALKARSTQYLEQFRSGSFDAFYEQVNEAFAQQVPKETLTSSWNTVMAQFGEYRSTEDVTFSQENNTAVVVVTEVYEMKTLVVTFAYNAENQVSGLNLSYGDATEPVPKETDQYQEVLMEVGYKEDQKLYGLLTLPKGTEKPPVVVMVQGSGPSDLNESIGLAPNKPFEDLAHGLAERGIATIRFNKRYYQYQPKTNEEVTVEDEVLLDVADAIELMKNDERVDGERIYLLGHSLGGMLAPKIASDNPDVKGIISMAGSLRRLEDLLLDQNKFTLEQNTELTDEQKATALQQVQAEVEKVKALTSEDKTSMIFGQSAVYWNSLNAIDSVALIKELTIPMLILQGEADVQVYAQTDYKLFETTLEGRDNVQFHLYPDLNHLFMTSTTDQISNTMYDTPDHVNKDVITDIADWIASLAPAQ